MQGVGASRARGQWAEFWQGCGALGAQAGGARMGAAVWGTDSRPPSMTLRLPQDRRPAPQHHCLASCLRPSVPSPHALRRRASLSEAMDALTGPDFDKLPFFFTNLYEKEALKLKEGQSEDWLDEDLRSSALAHGFCDDDLQLPVRPTSAPLPPIPPENPSPDPDPQQTAPDVLPAGASPLRRSSVSGNTQASCSTDITTPDSPASTDEHDRAFAFSLSARHSMPAAPPPATHARHSTSSLSSSTRSPKPRFFRRVSSFGKKYFRYVT